MAGPAQRLREVLQARAAALAKKATPEKSEASALVLFRRGGHLLGARIADVTGAGRVRELTQVPGAPVHLVGVVQTRGRVLSLLDLPVLWGETPKGAIDLTTYVVLTSAAGSFGVVTEELIGFHEVDADPVAYRGAPRPGLTEVAKLGEESVLVVSPEALSRESLLGEVR